MRIIAILVLLLLSCFGCSPSYTFDINSRDKIISPTSLQKFTPSLVNGIPQSCSIKFESLQDSVFIDEVMLWKEKKWIRSFIQTDIIDYVYLGELPTSKEHLLLIRYSGGTLTQVFLARIWMNKTTLKLKGYKQVYDLSDKIILLPNMQIDIKGRVYQIENT